MTMDKSLKVRLGLARARSVLTRAERIQRLKAADRWKEGDSPFGLSKVRVYKLAVKKKKRRRKRKGPRELKLPPPPRPPKAPKGSRQKEAGKKRPARGKPAEKEAGEKEGAKK